MTIEAVTTGDVAVDAIVVTGVGEERLVTLSGISGDGTAAIRAPEGLAGDNAGNLTPSTLGAAATVVMTRPTIRVTPREGWHLRI